MGLPLGCADIGAVLFGQELCAPSAHTALCPHRPRSSSPRACSRRVCTLLAACTRAHKQARVGAHMALAGLASS